jgi:hypothetical protein
MLNHQIYALFPKANHSSSLESTWDELLENNKNNYELAEVGIQQVHSRTLGCVADVLFRKHKYWWIS